MTWALLLLWQGHQITLMFPTEHACRQASRTVQADTDTGMRLIILCRKMGK